ncbi:hypothetical protein A9Q84_08970 [Halobacteriovorax marinus]|uniref:Phospholipase/carboxylesterase/thioesterase domain-containing protein n=1 Tax=Halobacteriovorax marinus TaxID=97084 RepID=A0A1Y5FAF5_9BACT|nr:hypothetical protein A9Q84_08970 [Halobacteriovorax marinus]
MNSENFEGLDTIISKGGDDIAIVVLHGYGANNQDFVPFSKVVLKSKNPTWYFFNGILPTMMGPYETGRCWFPIDMEGLEKSLNSGSFTKFFTSSVPDGLIDASSKVTKALESIRGKFDKVYLGGFSQGSMICADVAFHNSHLVDKLFLLSSTMVSDERWNKTCLNKLPFPIFQSHGIQDPVLPIQGAINLKSFLENTDNDPTYVEFPGAHEVPLEVVNKLELFLRESNED